MYGNSNRRISSKFASLVTLSEDQVRHLLGVIRNPVHKTCLAVMYACGLRISEATTLEVGAVDRANQVLRIIGKGDKERLVPLPRPVLDELTRLCVGKSPMHHLWRCFASSRDPVRAMSLRSFAEFWTQGKHGNQWPRSKAVKLFACL
jgi:site-specific recombinase XerD